MPSDLEVFAITVFAVSWLPIHLDPYYHQDRVNAWVWLQREIFELIYGEKAKAILGLE